MNCKLIILLIFTGFAIALGRDDEPDPFYFGVTGGGSFVQNETSIPLIPGADDCGNYGSGSELKPFGGITFGYQLLPELLTLDARVLYDPRPASLSEVRKNDFEVYDPASESYVPLERKFEYSAQLDYLVLDIGAIIKPLDFIPIGFRAGFDAGNPIITSEFENIEMIQSPDGVLYPNDSKTTVIDQGEFQNSGTALGVSGALQGIINLNEGMSLFPELSYRYGLNSPVSGLDWNVANIRGSLTLAWHFGGPKDELPPRDTIIPEPEEEPEPAEVVTKEEAIPMVEIQTEPLNIGETVVTQTYPLLPYIFFDSASSEIDPNYRNNYPPEEFSEGSLSKETLDIYYDILDIIGSRMKKNPSYELTITGTSDGRELDGDNNRMEIAGSRAASLMNYFVNRWGIEPGRFNLKASLSPALRTNTEYEEGFAENRRVEFSTKSPELFAPVMHSKFMEYVADRNNWDLQIDGKNFENDDQWELTLKAGNKSFKIKDGRGEPDDISLELNRDIVKALGSKNTNAHFLLTVYRKGDKQGTSRHDPVIYTKQNDYELGRLNLIVFDFDKYEISEMNRNMLNDFVLSSIQNNSVINITGYTDSLGELRYNKRLSRDRAEAVRDYILNLRPQARIESVRGLGPQTGLYDNSLPEGRFYYRTVLIEVKTPIEINLRENR